MPIDSWTQPDEAPDLAARATAMIDAALVGTELSRDAYWAAVRKGYNTPYNDPPPRRRAAEAGMPAVRVEIRAEEAVPVVPLAVAAAEVRAA